MSDTENPEPTTTDPAPETPAESAAKRERETWPIRILERVGDLYRVHAAAGTFARAEQAQRWIARQGADDGVYLPARTPDKATRVQPRRVEEVEL